LCQKKRKRKEKEKGKKFNWCVGGLKVERSNIVVM